MLTFNLKSRRNDNFYRGHAPGNDSSNCWSGRKNALVFDIEQARKIVAAWRGSMEIVIAVVADPAVDDREVDRELFCIRGGNWHWFRHRLRLGRMKACSHRGDDRCKLCGARWSLGGADWYDPETGATITEELVT